jgi:hypothetical protein
VVVVIFVLLLQQDPVRAACERHRVCTAGRRRVFGCGCRLERVRARIEEARVLLAEAVDRMVCTRLVIVAAWRIGEGYAGVVGFLRNRRCRRRRRGRN